MCLEWKDWKEAVADIYNICSLFSFVCIPTSFKGLYHRGLCPWPSPPSLEDCKQVTESRMRRLKTASQSLLKVPGAKEVPCYLATLCKTWPGLTDSPLLCCAIVS